MVKRLTALGWQVRGYDIVPERSSAPSVAEAVRGADVVLLNLPTNEAVEEVLAKLASPSCARRSSWSTSPPFRSMPAAAIAARLREATGCRWVDAPVSGGPPAVAAGNTDGDGRRRSRRIWSASRR